MNSADPVSVSFIVTKEHKRFVEFSNACRQYHYIGLCYGFPGVGKTLSARHYASWNWMESYCPYVLPGRTWASLPAEATKCRSVFYTASITATPSRISSEIGSLCLNVKHFAEEVAAAHESREPKYPNSDPQAELIIIDEADRLKSACLEQIRDIYDRQKIGLILIGMPGLEKRLARYPQLFSRVGFVHQFRTLSPDEVRFILANKWEQMGLQFEPDDFTDSEAIAAVIRITGGNFRLIHRLLNQIGRILEINEMRTVTKEVVEAARENLIIGPC